MKEELSGLQESWLEMLNNGDEEARYTAIFCLKMEDQVPPILLSAVARALPALTKALSLTYALNLLKESSKKIDFHELLGLLRKTPEPDSAEAITDFMLEHLRTNPDEKLFKEFIDSAIFRRGKNLNGNLNTTILSSDLSGAGTSLAAVVTLAQQSLSSQDVTESRLASAFFSDHVGLVNQEVVAFLFTTFQKNDNVTVKMAVALTLDKVEVLPGDIKETVTAFLKDEKNVEEYLLKIDEQALELARPPVANGKTSIPAGDYKLIGEITSLASRRIHNFKMDKMLEPGSESVEELKKAVIELNMILEAMKGELESSNYTSGWYLDLYLAHTNLNDNKAAQKAFECAIQFDPEMRDPLLSFYKGMNLINQKKNLQDAKVAFLLSILRSQATIFNRLEESEQQLVIETLKLNVTKGEFGLEYESLPVLNEFAQFLEKNPDLPDQHMAFADLYLKKA